MRLITRARTITIAALLLTPIPMLHAQTVDPVGHYDGSISSPAGEMRLQIDLTKTATGDIAGTLTIPAQKLTGFPLTNVIVKGNDVSFDIGGSGGGYFRGELNGKRTFRRFLDRDGTVSPEPRTSGRGADVSAAGERTHRKRTRRDVDRHA